MKMARSSRQKQKILYLAKFLLEETDEAHPATLRDMIRYLSDLGISAERKSLYSDLEELRVFGLDIICTRGKNVGYFVGDRTFQLPEVRLLVDAVQSSRFLTGKKSEELIGKLQTLVSRKEAGALSRTIYVAGRIKTMNESVYHNVDAISLAIEERKKLCFRYFDLDREGKRKYHREGGVYTVSPYFLIWDDENYYLVALVENGEKRHFRVDKMTAIETTDEMREGEKSFADIDPGEYEKKTFGMFGGTEERVRLWCHDSLAGVMFDRFGSSLATIRSGDGFEISATVQVSPVFLSWLMNFGDRAKILSPQWVKESFCDLARKALSVYQEDLK